MSVLENFNDLRKNSPNDVQFYHLGGGAGTGKTTEVLSAIGSGLRILLCASTGIAAVNLGGATTINQVLKYFDADSLATSFGEGYLTSTLMKLAKLYDFIVVDECGMISDKIAKIIYDALEQVNAVPNESGPLGIVWVGDFAQLPPVVENTKSKLLKSPWLFNNKLVASALKRSGHTTILTKNWRQSNEDFLRGLNYLRVGNGSSGVALLKKSGVTFQKSINLRFPGTTIVASNREADNYNQIVLNSIDADSYLIPSYRWHIDDHRGSSPSSWKNIKPLSEFKVGAYVMILNNLIDPLMGPIYSNGDCGKIVEIIEQPVAPSPHSYLTPFADIIQSLWTVNVQLARNGQVVPISHITRNVESPDEPTSSHPRLPRNEKGELIKIPKKPKGETWLHGQIRYLPLRLANYATVHKTQGLTLDAVQIDPSHYFFGSPAMAYVAASRCRTPEGLTIVGEPSSFALKTKMDKSVLDWI